jgi:hypothetical protein
MSTTESKNANPILVGYTLKPQNSAGTGIPVVTFDSGYQLTNVQVFQEAMGSTAAAMTVGKATGSTPTTSATPLLTATIDMGSPNLNLPVTGSLIGSAALCTFAAGDRLMIIPSGEIADAHFNATFTLLKV